MTRAQRATDAYYRRLADAWGMRVTYLTPYGAVEATPCAYCGEPWEQVDHVLPASVAAGFTASEVAHFREVLVTVPSCSECNAIAADEVVDSVTAKRDFIHQRLARRYRDRLKAPVWTPHEIAELRGSLRDRVQAQQARPPRHPLPRLPPQLAVNP